MAPEREKKLDLGSSRKCLIQKTHEELLQTRGTHTAPPTINWIFVSSTSVLPNKKKDDVWLNYPEWMGKKNLSYQDCFTSYIRLNLLELRLWYGCNICKPFGANYTNFLSNKLKMENKNNFKEQMEYFYRFLSLLYDSIVIDDD